MTRKNWRNLAFLAIAILLGVLVSVITMSIAPHMYQPANTSAKSDVANYITVPATWKHKCSKGNALEQCRGTQL